MVIPRSKPKFKYSISISLWSHAFFRLSINRYIEINFYYSYILFVYMSSIEPMFNLNTISLFTWYIRHPETNLWLPSKGKSTKLAVQGLLTYILLSNGCLVKLTFDLSRILYVKQSISYFLKKIHSYSIGKSLKLKFWE